MDNFGFFFLFASLGEIVVKRARGAKVNKSLDEIQNYLYPSSFVVQILISQTWMSFNNDAQWNCDSRGKYNGGTKMV